MQQVVERDDAGKREQEGVIVARRKQRSDGRNAVGALPVLHHDGLPPALGQLLGQQPRRQIHAAPRRQRHDEAHDLLRPTLRM